MIEVRKTLVFLGFLALMGPLLITLAYANYIETGSKGIEYLVESEYLRTQPIWVSMVTIVEMWMFSFLDFSGLNLVWLPLGLVLIYFGVRYHRKKVN